MKLKIEPRELGGRSRILGILFLIIIQFVILNSKFSILYSQNVQQEWVAIFNGSNSNYNIASSIAVDNSGNVYVTGYGYGTTPDYVTIKYNSSGVQQWSARYNGTGNFADYAYAIAIDNLGNVYVTGSSYGSSYDYLTIKYNSTGVQQWVARYDGRAHGNDYARAIATDRFGNVYVTGDCIDSVSSSEYVTIKYNFSGIQQWIANYHNNVYPYYSHGARAIAVDTSGNIYVTGDSYGNGTNDDYGTIKYNSQGLQQWVARYNGLGNGDDFGNAIVIDNLKNVYVTGNSIGNSSGNDYATIKYDSLGVQQWVVRYNGMGNSDDYATSIAVSNIGNVYITGYSRGIESNFNFATIKYNSSGVQQWVSTYNGTGNGDEMQYSHSLAIDTFENVYITGYSTGNGTGYDYATIKYNTSGVQQWVVRYNGEGNGSDVASSLAIDHIGNVFVTGWCSIGSYYDFCTIKYSQIVKNKRISVEIPDKFKLLQNYPNPFNPTTKIKFNIPNVSRESSIVSVVIYDILGREVATLVNERLQSGTYEVEWDGSNFASGVYFYRLTAGDFTDTKKLVLMK